MVTPHQPAWRQLLSSFNPDTFAWKGLLGTHVILIYKNDRLHILVDGLGASKIYANEDNTVWSNSFLVMLELASPKSFDTQACYEYVTSGCVFGRRTLVDGIRPSQQTRYFRSKVTKSERTNGPVRRKRNSGRSAHSRPSRRLPLYAALDASSPRSRRTIGDRIRLSFSGGFDSRLMLAMLMEHGPNRRCSFMAVMTTRM